MNKKLAFVFSAVLGITVATLVFAQEAMKANTITDSNTEMTNMDMNNMEMNNMDMNSMEMNNMDMNSMDMNNMENADTNADNMNEAAPATNTEAPAAKY